MVNVKHISVLFTGILFVASIVLLPKVTATEPLSTYTYSLNGTVHSTTINETEGASTITFLVHAASKHKTSEPTENEVIKPGDTIVIWFNSTKFPPRTRNQLSHGDSISTTVYGHPSRNWVASNITIISNNNLQTTVTPTPTESKQKTETNRTHNLIFLGIVLVFFVIVVVVSQRSTILKKLPNREE